MTTNRKNELIAQLVNILSELIEANDSDQVSEVKPDAVEMLTVKECTEGHLQLMKTGKCTERTMYSNCTTVTFYAKKQDNKQDNIF